MVHPCTHGSGGGLGGGRGGQGKDGGESGGSGGENGGGSDGGADGGLHSVRSYSVQPLYAELIRHKLMLDVSHSQQLNEVKNS